MKQFNMPPERVLRMTQPNIVVIIGDQLASKFTDAYGHSIAKTLHFDALTKCCMSFNVTYCNLSLYFAVAVSLYVRPIDQPDCSLR